MRAYLFGKVLAELRELVLEMGLPGFRAGQLAEWLYGKHCVDIGAMTTLSKSLREMLSEKYEVGRLPYEQVAVSADGCRKYLFPTHEGAHVESALIPDADRATLCVSTQVGCKRKCAFCMTGLQGFQGQLSAGEILNQYASCPEREVITNVVYMGMGEPLDNLDAVMKSIDVFTSDYGYAKSPTRLTVSTVGILAGLPRFIEGCQAHLAISLHSPFDEERVRLIPAQRSNPIREVVRLLKGYDFGRQRRLTFEYALFAGVNDSEEHARETVRLLNGLRCRVNLIPFNPAPEIPLRPASREKVEAFQELLKDKGVVTTIRKSKGQDIAAACGLLSTRRGATPASP
ncbi:MAG: 23S rRNA (adenine(2503)-C(2))-methyltransferase RlmN [Spartobacteria bacterium]|nr:23S rRNA (adenine(2503)-C(2))-methyltransferase RlmN [Spartobacteria bacterium]